MFAESPILTVGVSTKEGILKAMAYGAAGRTLVGKSMSLVQSTWFCVPIPPDVSCPDTYPERQKVMDS